MVFNPEKMAADRMWLRKQREKDAFLDRLRNRLPDELAALCELYLSSEEDKRKALLEAVRQILSDDA